MIYFIAVISILGIGLSLYMDKTSKKSAPLTRMDRELIWDTVRGFLDIFSKLLFLLGVLWFFLAIAQMILQSKH